MNAKWMQGMGAILMALAMMAATVTATLAADLMLMSPQLTDGGTMAPDQVYNGFGCTGKNISPELSWRGEPEGTRSFALTVYDPDAPTGSGWWHWVVFNIPATVHRLAENAGDPTRALMPEGVVQGKTDFGQTGYGGACPPAGDRPHRYVFTLFALDTETIPLDENVSPAMVGFFLRQHELARARITVTYGR